MKSSRGNLLSRRGLAALIASAPAAAGAVRQQSAPEGKSAAAEARAAQEGNRARLKAVKLPREVAPSFRFEP